jgi:pimeloyl-ACP methyl ester carboxylesterase
MADVTDAAAIGSAFAPRSVEAAGFNVRYWEAGEGAPIVCLPGAGGPRMTGALDLLAERFRVLVIELPGWGDQPNDVADFDGLADQVAEVIAALGLDAYHLLGTSLGAACALHLVTRHPERVISLTLEAPAKFRVDSRHPGELSPEELVRAFRTHPERPPQMAPPDPELIERVWPTVDRLMGTGEVDEAFLGRLRGVSTRTLILFGDADGIINPRNGPILRAAMPNAVLIYVYDAAHDIQGDRPEAFADVVDDFVRRGMNFLVNDAAGLINP